MSRYMIRVLVVERKESEKTAQRNGHGYQVLFCVTRYV